MTAPVTSAAPPGRAARPAAALTAGLVATVIFLTAIAPLATDMYVPAFPRVAGDLSASAAQVQLTLTTFFVGMALGQLVGGPFSDQHGRRRPLLAALALMSAASIVCALTPSIGVMMAGCARSRSPGGRCCETAGTSDICWSAGRRWVRCSPTWRRRRSCSSR